MHARFVRHSTQALAVIVVLSFFAIALSLATPPAQAVSTSVVISQVYGGGGNSGATYKNDFVELYNLGSAAVDLTGWSVQYASSAGTSWSKTVLSGTVQPVTETAVEPRLYSSMKSF